MALKNKDFQLNKELKPTWKSDTPYKNWIAFCYIKLHKNKCECFVNEVLQLSHGEISKYGYMSCKIPAAAVSKIVHIYIFISYYFRLFDYIMCICNWNLAHRLFDHV